MALTSILTEDGSELLALDGTPLISEDSTAETGTSGSASITDAPDAVAATGTVVEAKSGTGTIVESPDVVAATGTIFDNITATGAIVMEPDTIAATGGAYKPLVQAAAYSASALIGSDDAILAKTFGASAIAVPRMRVQSNYYSVSVLVVAAPPPPPKPFFPRRPGRIEPEPEVAERKRLLAPTKTLPEPPKDYDPNWMQQNQDALLKHLDTTLSANVPNASVMLRSPNGQVFEITIGDDGSVQATAKKG